MSNHCSNLFNHRSLFNPFHTPLKSYPTTLRPVFPFHSNLILISRRSRTGRSSFLPPLSAQSSSGIVLIATTEHHDGSLVFRFGDACEVVKNDEVVEETDRKSEWESNDVKVLDGDQERQEGGRLIELADGIGNDDIDSEVAERETTVVSDVRDYHAESIEQLSDISKKEVLSLQSDAYMNNYLQGVESTLEKTECTAQRDGDESLNATRLVLDNSPNRDNSADPERTLLMDSDYKTEDPSGSGELESMQVSCIEFMDVKQPNAVDELHKLETEDASKSDTKDLVPPATMHFSDVELMDAANEDVEEELQDINSNEGTLIDEMPPSDPLGAEPMLDEVSQPQSAHVKVEATMEVSSTKAEDVKDQATEDELQQMSTDNRDENNVACLMADSFIEETEPILEEEVSQPQSAPVQLKTTMQVSDIELEDTMGQNVDDEIPQVIDVTEDPSVSVKIENMQVSHTEVMDVTQPYAEEELHKVETEDTSESDTEDLIPPATMLIPDVELTDAANEDLEEGLQDMNINEGTLIDGVPPSDPLGAEPALDEVSQIQSARVKVEGTIVEEEVSQLQSTPVELKPTVNISDIELQNTIGQYVDDGILQVIDETEDPSVTVNIETMQVSHIEVMDVTQPYAEEELHKVESEDNSESDTENLMPPATMLISDVELTDAANEDAEEGLQDMNINEGTLIDGMPPSDPLGAEPTLDDVSQLQSIHVKVEATIEVSSTKAVDIEDRAIEDDLQQVSTDNRNENDVAYVMPVSRIEEAEPILEDDVSQLRSTPVELKPTMQVSDIEVQDSTGQNLNDGISQVIDDNAGEGFLKDVEPSFHQLEAQPVQDEGVNHNMLEQCAETDALGSSILVKQGANGSLWEEERIEGKVNSSELAEASEDSVLLSEAEAKVKREEIYLTSYFLSSSATLLEHPFKALTGGDDAYFVAGSKWLGVASGVSQWSFEGTKRGVYAQELMKTCEGIVLDTSSVPMSTPVELLCRGVKETNMSGSSNVLIANFEDQALRVANIGDTGFMIIRHGAIYKKSSPLLHEFHFALQVEDCDDPLQLVEEYRIELDEGDIVVSATDGLFDNLYEQEIAMIVSKSLQAGMKAEEIAKILATRAQEVGRSAFVRSPFSDAAQAAGYTGYSGGKPDNVAVIVSLVEKRSNLLAE